MSPQRKRFRIEEFTLGSAPPLVPIDTEAGPTHHDLMSELRAIRTQIVGGGHATGVGNKEIDASVANEVAEARALLATYRAQIEQCEKLKIELDLIHNAIDQTKREIAVLHTKSFNGEEMAKVNGELGAVVGGTEEATQQILEAAEAIDQAATALGKVTSVDQQKALSEEIQERVIAIFEACNFQDLTGQRITKVVNVLRFIEDRVNRMMEIWGGMEAFNTIEADESLRRVGDAALLNGPARPTVDCATQDDIDALFA